MAGNKNTPAQHRRGGFWRVAARECGRIASSPFYVLFIFIFPIGAFTVFSIVFLEPVPRKLPVAVHDADATKLSRQLIRMMDATPFVNVIGTVEDMAAGAALVRAGKAYAVVHIPGHFERDAGRADAPAVALYCNTQWLLVSGLVSRSLREAAGTLSAGIDLRSRMMRGEDPAAALERFEPIVLEQHALFNPWLSYRDFLLPPLFIAALQIFVTVMTVSAIGLELKHATAGAWLEAAGGRTAWALLGKLAPYTAMFLLLAALALVWLYRYTGIAFKRQRCADGVDHGPLRAGLPVHGLRLYCAAREPPARRKRRGFLRRPRGRLRGLYLPRHRHARRGQGLG